MLRNLSRSARILLARGFFFVMSLGAFYGAWQNRAFITAVTFLFIVIADILFGLLFAYFSLLSPKLLAHKKRLVTGALTLAWLYIVGGNVIGSTLHAQQVGLSKAAASAGFTIPLYLASELLYLVILPSIAIAIIWYFVGSL